MLVTDPDPARWISTLGGYTLLAPATPTARWTPSWTVATGQLAYERCVYGIYVREVQFRKWVAPDVAALVSGFPGDIGTGTFPGDWDAFCVPDTDVQGRGRWLLLYIGISVSTENPRIVQYFGKTQTFTREPGGQSFHLDLGQLFGGPVDIRNRTAPPSKSIAGALRGALSMNLESRMREMDLSYAQVTCPGCICTQKGRLAGCTPPVDAASPAGCIHDNEQRLIHPYAAGAPDWGARPLMNSRW